MSIIDTHKWHKMGKNYIVSTSYVVFSMEIGDNIMNTGPEIIIYLLRTTQYTIYSINSSRLSQLPIPRWTNNGGSLILLNLKKVKIKYEQKVISAEVLWTLFCTLYTTV